MLNKIKINIKKGKDGVFNFKKIKVRGVEGWRYRENEASSSLSEGRALDQKSILFTGP